MRTPRLFFSGVSVIAVAHPLVVDGFVRRTRLDARLRWLDYRTYASLGDTQYAQGPPMRRAEPWLIAISLAGGLITGVPRVSAQPSGQPDVRDNRAPGPPPGDRDRDRRRPARPVDAPTEAPPSPR